MNHSTPLNLNTLHLGNFCLAKLDYNISILKYQYDLLC